jgi:hypothetical protein
MRRGVDLHTTAATGEHEEAGEVSTRQQGSLCDYTTPILEYW